MIDIMNICKFNIKKYIFLKFLLIGQKEKTQDYVHIQRKGTDKVYSYTL